MTQCAFTTIMVGIDFSRSSIHALETVRDRFPEAQVYLVHITEVNSPISDPVTGFVPYDPGLYQRNQEKDSARLADLAAEGEICVNLQGEPVMSMLRLARDRDADLLVVGTHARGPIEHFFLGSTAEKLVARSPIPVLTVRQPSRGEDRKKVETE